MVTFFKWCAVVVVAALAFIVHIAIERWNDPNYLNPFAGTSCKTYDEFQEKVEIAIGEGFKQLIINAQNGEGSFVVIPKENTSVEQEKIR